MSTARTTLRALRAPVAATFAALATLATTACSVATADGRFLSDTVSVTPERLPDGTYRALVHAARRRSVEAPCELENGDLGKTLSCEDFVEERAEVLGVTCEPAEACGDLVPTPEAATFPLLRARAEVHVQLAYPGEAPIAHDEAIDLTAGLLGVELAVRAPDTQTFEQPELHVTFVGTALAACVAGRVTPSVRAAGVGLWHNGVEVPTTPDARGFDGCRTFTPDRPGVVDLTAGVLDLPRVRAAARRVVDVGTVTAVSAHGDCGAAVTRATYEGTGALVARVRALGTTALGTGWLPATRLRLRVAGELLAPEVNRADGAEAAFRLAAPARAAELEVDGVGVPITLVSACPR